MVVKALGPDALFTRCDPKSLKFKTTAEVEASDGPIAQDRAVQAIRFAIGIENEGYNLFAAGPEGVGRFTLVSKFLAAAAASRPVADDWCYINNFAEPHKPKALRLPPGRGCALRAQMERLVEDLRSAIPAAFETDEYRNRRGVIEEGLKELHEERFMALQEEAKKNDVSIVQTPMGFAVAPVKNGEVIPPKDFDALPEEEKAHYKAGMEALQERLGETLRQMPTLEREQREKLRKLNQEVTGYAVGFLIDEVKRHWADLPEVIVYLEAVRADVTDNLEHFLPSPKREREEEEEEAPALTKALRSGWNFRRYRVNVIIDNASAVSLPLVSRSGLRKEVVAEANACGVPPDKGAPVIYEDHPTQPNLSGRIEHLAQFGALVTDFNLIKAGALHRANGGFLILDARKLLMQPFAWETLMRALRSQTIRIETPAESFGWSTTITLEPEPIPLTLKVILLGEPLLYYQLRQLDPDFLEMFKVAADFDTVMDRNEENAFHLTQFIASLSRREALLPMTNNGVARVIEHASRLVEDREKLISDLGALGELVREASYWAKSAGAANVSADHVQKAIEAKIYRSDRIRERIQEQIIRGSVVIESSGAKVGQVNGLSVFMLDDFAFGKPSRISCRVAVGRGQVVDIEREVALGGPLHSKGVLILSSFLAGRFAQAHPLSLTANLVFEQSYGGVDGDSASSAELYAILSALSGIPIRQGFAVTGSVDQYGTVQAIGGVNEKIEGHFDICRAKGLTGEQGVLIPATNVKNLMLRADVVRAVKEGKFRVYPVETIDQGIEILTGRKAGAETRKGTFPKGSVNAAVAETLARFARKARAFALPRQRARLKRGGSKR